jgi:hypothetical protein
MGAMRRGTLPKPGGLPIFVGGRKRTQETDMGIISKARSALERYRQYDPEQAYLEQATSIIDLESRQREIDRGKFRKPRNWQF